MMIQYILDANGNPQPEPDVLAWSRWFQTAERRVDSNVINDVRVSTVFLGLDHRFSFDRGEPLLFETMVFGGPLDGEQKRYSTKAEALAGHAAMVKRVMEAVAA